MLSITGDQMTAFEAAMQNAQLRAFLDWVERHRAILGDVPRDFTLDTVRGEAARAGIDTDARLFVYAAARGIMPQMTGAQYLLVTDVVFAPLSEEKKLQAIVAIRDQPRD